MRGFDGARGACMRGFDGVCGAFREGYGGVDCAWLAGPEGRALVLRNVDRPKSTGQFKERLRTGPKSTGRPQNRPARCEWLKWPLVSHY